MPTTLPASTIMRGNPPSISHQPDPGLIAALFERIEAQANGTISYFVDDLADLPAASGVTNGVFAVVLNDATSTYRGVYQEQSDAWVKTAELSSSFSQSLPVILTIGGTADALTATSNRGYSTTALEEIFVGQMPVDNNASATLSIDGGTAKPIVTWEGDTVSAAYLPENAIVWLQDDGTNYVLTGPVDIAAVQAICVSSATQAASSEAAAIAAAEASGAITFYDTKADANTGLGGHSNNDVVEVLVDESLGGLRTRYRVESAAYVFKVVLDSVGIEVADVTSLLADTALTYASGLVATDDIISTRTEGYRYKVAASGASDHQLTTAGGLKLYVLPIAGGTPVEVFGAVGDGSTDDRAAIQSAWDWSSDSENVVTALAKTYIIGDSGSDISSRSYGLLLKSGVRFRGAGMYATVLKAANSSDIDVINTIRSGSPTGIELSGFTIDGNEANQGATPSNGFNLWAYNIDDLLIHQVKSVNPASWGLRIQDCTEVDMDGIVCDHSAESNSDGVHFVDTSRVTVGSCRVKSLGDDGFIIEALGSNVADYTIGELLIDTDNSLAIPARGFLLLGDSSVMTGARVIKNIRANVVARNCDGGAVVLSGASFENIQIESMSYNCGYDLQIIAGTATYTGYVTNCRFVVDGADAQTGGISTNITNSTIKHCHLDARIHNPATAASAIAIYGEYWTGSVQAIYDGTTGTSAGVNWHADNSDMQVTARGAATGLLVQGGATNNTFRLGTLSGNTTNDLSVAGGASGNRFIGGQIAGSVSLSATDERFTAVKGANYEAKVSLNFSTNADGTVQVPHGLVGTPKRFQLTPDTATPVHLQIDTGTVPDATNFTIKGTDASGAALTSGSLNCQVQASL